MKFFSVTYLAIAALLLWGPRPRTGGRQRHTAVSAG
jgi:hypothetical protein